MTYDELFIQISGCFFCANLPRNWKELNSADIHRWADKYPYEKYEYWDASDIICEIESVTNTVWKCMYINNKDVRADIFTTYDTACAVRFFREGYDIYIRTGPKNADYKCVSVEEIVAEDSHLFAVRQPTSIDRPSYRKCENGVGVWEMVECGEVFDTLSELWAEYPDAVLEGEAA